MSTLQDKTALDGRSGQEAESLVSEIQAKAGRAEAISADLGTPNGVALLAKQVRSIVGDRLDVLVLNAGISKAARIADYTVEEFDNLFATNVRSPFFLVQQLLPILGDRSNIVLISSAVARTVVGKPGLEDPSILAYASTEGAIETLVKHWAAILVFRLSWNWRKRSSVKITERTYEEGTEAFHTRRKSSHLEAASCGQSTRLGAV